MAYLLGPGDQASARHRSELGTALQHDVRPEVRGCHVQRHPRIPSDVRGLRARRRHRDPDDPVAADTEHDVGQLRSAVGLHRRENAALDRCRVPEG